MRPFPRSSARPRRQLLLAAAVLSSAACSPVFDWRDTRFPEADGVSALFPCKPDRVARRIRLAGDVVNFALASCSAGGLTFAFGHVEVADAARVAPALAALQAAAAANVGGAAGASTAARVPGSAMEPAPIRLSLQGRRPDGGPLVETAVLFAKGRRVFQASVVGPAIGAETADTFLASFSVAD